MTDSYPLERARLYTMIHQKTIHVDIVYKCTPSVNVQNFLGLPENAGALAMGQQPPVNSLGEIEYPHSSPLWGSLLLYSVLNFTC